MSGEGIDRTMTQFPQGLSDDARVSYNRRRIELSGLQLSTLAPDPSEHPTVMNVSPVRGRAASAGGDSDFEFTRLLAKGGFGAVWAGVQKKLHRVVAIKRMRGDIVQATAMHEGHLNLLERMFREEALVAAQLDHPNIVPVYRLGTDADGLPILAMKLVHGHSWNDEIDDDFTRLSVDDFLARHIPILVEVSQAVAFAHSRGIMHRDLKSAQVMVGEYGEVLLMDWGLAVNFDEAALRQNGRGEILSALPTLATAINPGGTPGYMAPEQTHDTAENLGPWTDVYLLGGMLYQLLTGTTPHVGKASEAVSMAARGEYVALRSAVPNREMPVELASLVEEALKPSYKERTLTAQEFIMRLKDYLSGAGGRRESRSITEEVSRILDSGTQGYDELGDAINSLTHAQILWAGNPLAAGLRERALGIYARTALGHGDFVVAKVQATRLSSLGEQNAVLLAIARGEARARSQARTRRLAMGGIMVLVSIAAAGSLLFSRRLAEEAGEREQARVMAVMAKDTAQRASMAASLSRSDANALVSFMLGDLQAKLDEVGKLDILQSIAEEAKGYVSADEERGGAPDLILQRIEILRNLARLSHARGDAEGALVLLKEAETKLGIKPSPDSADGLLEVYASIKDDEVLPLLDLGRLDEARDVCDEVIVVRQRLLAYDPENTLVRHGLFTAWTNKGGIEEYGNLADALEAVSKARDIIEELVALNPTNKTWQEDRAYAWTRVGIILAGQGELEKALAVYDKALPLCEKLVANDPRNIHVVRQLADAYGVIGGIHEQSQEVDKALSYFKRQLDIRANIAASDPGNLLWQRQHSNALIDVAAMLTSLGRTDEAEPLALQALAISQELLRKDPTDQLWKACVANAWESVASIHEARKEYGEALPAFERTLALNRELASADPDNTIRQQNVASALGRIASIRKKEGQFEESVKTYSESVSIYEKLSNSDPTNTDWLASFAGELGYRGEVLIAAGKTVEAHADLEKQLSITARMATDSPQEPVLQLQHASALMEMGQLFKAEDNCVEAAAAYGKALTIADGSLKSNPDHREFKLLRADVLFLVASISDVDNARRAFQQALAIQEELLGSEDEDTQKTRRALKDLGAPTAR